MATILCVDDEPSVGVVLEHTLTKIGHRPLLVSSVDDAVETVGRTSVDLVIADYVMPRLNGLDLLRILEKEGYQIPVIIMTGYSSIENAVVSIKSGAVDYLTKPIRAETLEIAINQALEQMRLRRENETLRSEIQKLRSARAPGGEAESLAAALTPPAPVDPPIFDLDELERRAIDRALKATGGNRTRAAKLLGISERTLRNKLNGPKVTAADP
ncbi:MAG: response regulator [Gemmatimonadales bacterium]